MGKKQNNASSVGSALGRSIKESCYFLTILFCTLRACDVINWSWFWIMSPIFFSWVLALIGFSIVGVITAATLNDD